MIMVKLQHRGGEKELWDEVSWVLDGRQGENVRSWLDWFDGRKYLNGKIQPIRDLRQCLNEVYRVINIWLLDTFEH
jgi:hypothetical protein